MESQEVKSICLGIKTDPPPDRLGNSALRTLNVVPASNQSIKPRDGTEKIGLYGSGVSASLGRKVIIDTLPGRTDGSYMVALVNTTAGGSTVESIFKMQAKITGGDNPAVIAYPNATVTPEYDIEVSDTTNKFYGVVAGEYVPTEYDIFGVDEEFTGAFGASSAYTAMAVAVLPPCSFNDVFYADGVLAVLIHHLTDATNMEWIVRLYSLTDSTLIATPSVTVALAGGTIPPAASQPYCGIAPLQSGRDGFVFWYPTASDYSASKVHVVLSSYVTTVGSNRRLILEDDLTYDVSGPVCSVSPYSKTALLYLLVGVGSTTSGESQVYCLRLDLTTTGWPESPTDSDLFTYNVVWSQEYIPAEWVVRKDSCLAAQNIPVNAGTTQQGLVLLMGTLSDKTHYLSVTDPRLAFVGTDGEEYSDGSYYTHTNGYGRANGMCISHLGDVYVTGTRDIVNNGNYLICRYDINNPGVTLSRVLHGTDGLGAETGDADQTNVCNPVWTGEYLFVEDRTAAGTYIYVYEQDLTYVTKFLLSSTTGEAWRSGQFSVKWWGETY